MKATTRTPSWAWLLAGIFLLQTAWTLVVPPYAGIDEFDHAYRAASVAHGHVTPGEPAVDGRGLLVRVPEHIVDAAHKACMSFDYVGPDNCSTTAPPDSDGDDLVASAAGSYNPFYYSLVGLPTLVLDGDAALYGMRFANVLLSCLLVGLCLATVSRQSSSPWPMTGIALTLTPVVMYASSTVAPNGLEIISGILMWTLGLVLAYGDEPRVHHWWMLAMVLALVATLHTTGPLWCMLFGLCFVTLPRGRTALRRAWSDERFHLLGAAATAVVGGVLAITWILVQGANIRGGDDGNLGAVPIADLLRENLLWVFQTIGAVPFRNQHIPVAAMAAALVVFLLVLVLGYRRAVLRERAVVALLIIGFFGAGSATTILTYDKVGLAWQGRYVLPFACGLPLLSTWLIARSAGTRLTIILPRLVWVMFVLINGWALIAVLQGQRAWEPTLNWAAPGDPLIAAMGAAGLAATFVGLRTQGAPAMESTATTQHAPHEVDA